MEKKALWVSPNEITEEQLRGIGTCQLIHRKSPDHDFEDIKTILKVRMKREISVASGNTCSRCGKRAQWEYRQIQGEFLFCSVTCQEKYNEENAKRPPQRLAKEEDVTLVQKFVDTMCGLEDKQRRREIRAAMLVVAERE